MKPMLLCGTQPKSIKIRCIPFCKLARSWTSPGRTIGNLLLAPPTKSSSGPLTCPRYQSKCGKVIRAALKASSGIKKAICWQVSLLTILKYWFGLLNQSNTSYLLTSKTALLETSSGAISTRTQTILIKQVSASSSPWVLIRPFVFMTSQGTRLSVSWPWSTKHILEVCLLVQTISFLLSAVRTRISTSGPSKTKSWSGASLTQMRVRKVTKIK